MTIRQTLREIKNIMNLFDKEDDANQQIKLNSCLQRIVKMIFKQSLLLNFDQLTSLTNWPQDRLSKKEFQRIRNQKIIEKD